MAIKLVVEVSVIVYLAVMHMNCRKEQLRRIGQRKLEGHRMELLLACFELEDGKGKVPVPRQRFPSCVGQAEACIKPLEICDRRHKRGFEAANVFHRKWCCFHILVHCSTHAVNSATLRNGESILQFAEKFGLLFKIDKRHRVLTRFGRHGQR